MTTPSTTDSTPQVTAFLGLGANAGNTLDTLAAAVFTIDDVDGITVEDVSGVYRTPPWPPPGDSRAVTQQDFHNLAMRVSTVLTADALLDALQEIETALGRDRATEVRWGPRPLDIDILLYGAETITTPRLVVPHAHLSERAFVVVPLMEVFPGGALPDGRRLTQIAMALDMTDITLELRFDEMPGRIARPTGPTGPSPSFARPTDDDIAGLHGQPPRSDRT